MIDISYELSPIFINKLIYMHHKVQRVFFSRILKNDPIPILLRNTGFALCAFLRSDSTEEIFSCKEKN